jgi:LacI family purine nucleotide synthesis repressor
MATIKDVAQLAGVSSTTVSIVLNGKGEERKIPPETRTRIEEAIAQLHYQPNLSARKLRNTGGQKPVIALYWPIDYRINMLASFLNAMQNEFKRKKFETELVVQTYKNDHINKDFDATIKGNYNAVMVGAAAEKDIAYLESIILTLPLILINRPSDKYATVGIDNEKLAQYAARLFHDKGYHEIAVVRSAEKYYATNLRTSKFMETCRGYGIAIPDEFILRTKNTQDGGIEAAKLFSALGGKKPKAIFCDSDTIALGMVYAFNRQGIQIPKDLEIMTIAMTEVQNTAYYTPSITSISMPTGKIAALAVDITVDALAKHSVSPRHELVEPQLNKHESFLV